MATSNRSNLVSKLKSFIRRYVVVTDNQLEVLSHYILHTHQFSERCQQPFTTPYLFINSAQKGSGKTLLGIDILGKLCRNYEAVNNVTEATLFRLANMHATIGIDEVDMLFSGNRTDDGMVSVLNSGYRKGGYVPRADSKEPDGVKRYNTFSPKILIGIDSGTMKDTTRDRCIPINMKRATDDERKTVSRFLSYKIEDELESLNHEIYEWSVNNTVGMRDYEPEMAEVNPRQEEVCVTLLQVARKTGREKELRKALLQIYSDTVVHEDTPEIDMLVTLRDMFEENGDKIRSAELLNRLQIDPRFKNWSGKMLAVKLAPFGIRIKPVRGPWQPAVQRAIVKGECLDAFARYLK